MSRIKEMIENLEECDGSFKKSKKTSVTARLLPDYLNKLDFLAKRFGVTRSSFAQGLMEQAVDEGIDALGLDPDDLQAHLISFRSGRDLAAVKADLAKTGFFIDGLKVDPADVPDMLANPEKYGIPITPMTEEEIKEQEAREEAEKEQEVK
jgi:hypothetical protein